MKEKIELLDANQLAAVENLRDAAFSPQEGLPEELFLLISGLVPLPNVDMLITNEKNELLLRRRVDSWFQNSWHIPGGCMHYGEEFLTCVHKTALRELGTDVFVKPDPIAVRNVIRGVDPTKRYPRERGHNVAILFACTVPEGWYPENGSKNEMDNGYMKWFDTLPTDFMTIQDVYADVLLPWTKEKGRRENEGECMDC